MCTVLAVEDQCGRSCGRVTVVLSCRLFGVVLVGVGGSGGQFNQPGRVCFRPV